MTTIELEHGQVHDDTKWEKVQKTMRVDMKPDMTDWESIESVEEYEEQTAEGLGQVHGHATQQQLPTRNPFAVKKRTALAKPSYFSTRKMYISSISQFYDRKGAGMMLLLKMTRRKG